VSDETGDWLGKVDAASGYHTVKIDARYTSYLCFQWKGNFYAFLVLPFGLAIAPWVYQNFGGLIIFP